MLIYKYNNDAWIFFHTHHTHSLDKINIKIKIVFMPLKNTFKILTPLLKYYINIYLGTFPFLT